MPSKRKSSRSSRKENPNATELLVLELQEIHSAETQLSRVLPRLAKAAESDTLRQMVDRRLTEGERVLKDVEGILEELDESPGRKRNIAAEGLINDAREHVQEIEQGPALDSVLVAALQKTEHYCIAAWGTARSLGEALGQASAVKAMERALKEGKDVDEQLTQLAEKELTPALLQGESQEEEEDEEEASTPARRSRKDGGSERRTRN
jgi:ferritin-like metal-binding protein YciE